MSKTQREMSVSFNGLSTRPARRLTDLTDAVRSEHEGLFDADLNLIGCRDNRAGDVDGFAPPGDIHRIRNNTETTAISIHVYGTDVARLGGSARRYYD